MNLRVGVAAASITYIRTGENVTAQSGIEVFSRWKRCFPNFLTGSFKSLIYQQAPLAVLTYCSDLID